MRSFRCNVRFGLMRLVLIYLRALATTTGTAATTPKLKNLIGRVRKNRGELHVWRALWNNSVLYSSRQQREMTTLFLIFKRKPVRSTQQLILLTLFIIRPVSSDQTDFIRDSNKMSKGN